MNMVKVICIITLIAGIATCALAEESKRTAQIVSLDGKAEVKLMGQSNWTPAQVGTVLHEGDTLKTAAGAAALLNVDGKGQTATIDVSEKSQLLLSQMLYNKEKGTSKTLLDLAMGEVLIKAQKVHGEESKFEVKTPTSIVGVRGTTFKVKVESAE